MARRTLENQWAEVQGKFDALGDTLVGLWNVAVDAGDLVVTGLLGGDDAQALYEFVSGSEVGSLTERNNLAKGAVEGYTNTVAYVEKVTTGQKAFGEILHDAGRAAAWIGEGLYDDYIDPFVKAEQYKQENLHGGLWTRSVEESYAKGQNEFKKDMVLLEAGLTAVSGGTGTMALKSGKVATRLDMDTPDVAKKQLHGERDADGKGKGGPLPHSAAQDRRGGIRLKDGKFKTRAKLLDDVLKDLNETIVKFLEKMSEYLNGKLVVMENAATGQRYLAWQKGEGYFYSKNRAGEGGSVSKTSGQDISLEKRGAEATGNAGSGSKPPVYQKVKYGDHFTRKNRKKALKPNVEYTSPDGYTYRTDSLGRIIDCEGTLVLGKGERSVYAQKTVGKGQGRLPDDDGGHLIGAQFKGPKDIDNLVPQNSQINRSGGVWYQMETEWANALNEVPPRKVTVKIEPIYSGSSMRPDAFEVVYKIEGKGTFEKTIKNQSGG
ncbi:DNA/RNA non-specific endonuclease [Brevibacillus agri]